MEKGRKASTVVLHTARLCCRVCLLAPSHGDAIAAKEQREEERTNRQAVGVAEWKDLQTRHSPQSHPRHIHQLSQLGGSEMRLIVEGSRPAPNIVFLQFFGN